MPWSSSLAYTVAGASSTNSSESRTRWSSLRSSSDSARGWAAGTRSGVGGGGLWRWRRYQRAWASPTAAHPARTPTSGANSATAWSVTSSRPQAPGRCRWRAAPTAPRAFPGPRSPCGPCQARPAGAGSPCAAGPAAGRGDRPAGDRRAWPAPAAHRGRAACATRRSARCTGLRAAAARPWRPCPAAHTPPRSAPCSWPSTGADHGHARGPRGPARSCRSRRQPGRAHPENDRSSWSPGELLPRPLSSTIQQPDLPHRRLTQRVLIVGFSSTTATGQTGGTMSTFHRQPSDGDAVAGLLQSAWRYKALIAAAVLLGALLGYGWAARQPTLYEGTSWVFIANGCPTDVLCRPLRDHAQLMRSPAVLQRAVKLNGSRISAETLRQRLQVDVAWSAHVIRIRVADSTAKGAAQLANAVSAAYQQVVAHQARKVADQLSRARSELKTSLAETEAELVRNPNDPRLRAQRTAVTDELSQVQRQLRAAHRQLLRKLAAVPKQPIISPSPGPAMMIGMLVGLLVSAVLVWWLTHRQGPTSTSSASEGPEMPSPA